MRDPKKAIEDLREKGRVKTAVLRKLDPIAKEINVRLEKAEKLDDQSKDHSIAAGYQLQEAREVCRKNKNTWKTWVEKNIHYSVRHCDRLLEAVGAPDPKKAISKADDPVKAKITHRKKEATRQRKRRAKTRVRTHAEPKVTEETPTAPAPRKTEFDAADEYLAKLDENVQVGLMESRAHALGYVVMASERVAELKKAAVAPKNSVHGQCKDITLTPKSLFTAFLALKPSDKVMFVKWATVTWSVLPSWHPTPWRSVRAP